VGRGLSDLQRRALSRLAAGARPAAHGEFSVTHWLLAAFFCCGLPAGLAGLACLTVWLAWRTRPRPPHQNGGGRPPPGGYLDDRRPDEPEPPAPRRRKKGE
jgi:hypothetical protein